MTVDIGPRQSGKTTRLIEAMVQFLEDNPNKTALYVTSHNRAEIKSKMETICGDCTHRVITSYKMMPTSPNPTMKQFVDEFGCMKGENLTLDPEAYYCSSYNPDFNPWPQETESMDGYSSIASQIVEYYNWNSIDRWNILPKKNVFKHEF